MCIRDRTYGDDSVYVIQSLEHKAYKLFEKPKPNDVPPPQPEKEGDPITDLQKYAYDAALRMETVEYQTNLEVWQRKRKPI